MRYLDFANSPTPRTNEKPERVIVCIDGSPSMLAGDWPPSRLRGAQDASLALVKRKYELTPDDEIGVVAYASKARVMCKPLIVGDEHARIQNAIRSITTAYCTNISAGLRAAGDLLLCDKRRSWWDKLMETGEVSEDFEQRCLRIILLTDGHQNSGEQPIPVAGELKSKSVIIDCIGIGGDPSDVNEEELKAIASMGQDGVTPRYAFIGDTASLIRKFEQLADRICR